MDKDLFENVVSRADVRCGMYSHLTGWQWVEVHPVFYDTYWRVLQELEAQEHFTINGDKSNFEAISSNGQTVCGFIVCGDSAARIDEWNTKLLGFAGQKKAA